MHNINLRQSKILNHTRIFSQHSARLCFWKRIKLNKILI